ncbi:MAG: MTAP family purine nucleoside phosphorylase [Candidatus Thermoplasmatota archaeon]|jgi:5'-methylthioadenosine phosphorylase|nr:MTAP family purine nucleoside phosphorylase [Candidatus Thermoplasmatota archaeon]
MKIGVIYGHRIPNFVKKTEKIEVETPYGKVNIESAKLYDHEIFLLNRHGKQSNLPPHKVNYLGNIWALSSCHVDCILAISVVGSLKKNIKPGDLVVPHDFVDFTKSRTYTFFDEKRVHVDMTSPYCLSLRDILIKSCKKQGAAIKLHDKGVYLATEGPRLETPAEIKLFSQYTDIVGMTAVPEIVLAREKGICYASLCVVCNMAAGMQSKLTADEISNLYKKKEPFVSKILKSTIEDIEEKTSCGCKRILSKASL